MTVGGGSKSHSGGERGHASGSYGKQHAFHSALLTDLL